MEGFGLIIAIAVFVVLLFIVLSCVKVVPQAETYVVERLGACQNIWHVGLHLKMPIAWTARARSSPPTRACGCRAAAAGPSLTCAMSMA